MGKNYEEKLEINRKYGIARGYELFVYLERKADFGYRRSFIYRVFLGWQIN